VKVVVKVMELVIVDGDLKLKRFCMGVLIHDSLTSE
jgi:hypothetical protein